MEEANRRFGLPENVEKQLREELGDLDQAAKEAALVELYRLGKLSHGMLAESLGLSRYETVCEAFAVNDRHFGHIPWQ